MSDTSHRYGPYEIVAPLSAGGMGEVFRARDTRLQRDVAVKILPKAVAADSDRRRRFFQEAQATGALNHPNILSIHDVHLEGDTPYLVTELVEGTTLRDEIDRLAWLSGTRFGRPVLPLVCRINATSSTPGAG